MMTAGRVPPPDQMVTSSGIRRPVSPGWRLFGGASPLFGHAGPSPPAQGPPGRRFPSCEFGPVAPLRSGRRSPEMVLHGLERLRPSAASRSSVAPARVLCCSTASRQRFGEVRVETRTTPRPARTVDHLAQAAFRRGTSRNADYAETGADRRSLSSGSVSARYESKRGLRRRSCPGSGMHPSEWSGSMRPLVEHLREF